MVGGKVDEASFALRGSNRMPGVCPRSHIRRPHPRGLFTCPIDYVACGCGELQFFLSARSLEGEPGTTVGVPQDRLAASLLDAIAAGRAADEIEALGRPHRGVN